MSEAEQIYDEIEFIAEANGPSDALNTIRKKYNIDIDPGSFRVLSTKTWRIFLINIALHQKQIRVNS